MRHYDYYGIADFKFSASDIYIGVFVIMFIIVYGFIKATLNRETNPLYKYYLSGLVIKLSGAIIFALVYAFVYRGGDTIAYWWGAEALKNLFYSNSSHFIAEMFYEPTTEGFFNHYNSETGWPPEWLYRSPRHFFICKAASVICIFIPGSFLGVSAFMGFLSFSAMWKLFETMQFHFSGFTKNLRIGILFLPSTLFWCSGIMKDTVVMAAVCWIVYETDIYLRNDKRKSRLRLAIMLIFSGWLIMSCKPYVIIALAPAWLVWMNYAALSRIKSGILKYYLIPILVVVSSVLMFQLYAQTNAQTEFSPDSVIDKALVVRNDFSTNTAYGNNRFAAQKVNNSSTDLLRVIPESLMSGLFRPFIWESRSPYILMTSIENLFILIFFIYALIKLKIFGLIKFIRSNPILLFSVIYTLILAIIVGFTAILFGALIRLRTPFLPFFVSFIAIAIGKIRMIKIIAEYPSNTSMNPQQGN